MEELYGTRYQSGSFSLNNVGSDFHCLRSFSFFVSTLIRRRFQVKPATLRILNDISFLVEEFYGTQYQSGSFSFINVGSDFHCLRSSLSFQNELHVYQIRLQRE